MAEDKTETSVMTVNTTTANGVTRPPLSDRRSGSFFGSSTSPQSTQTTGRRVDVFRNVCLPETPRDSRWDVEFLNGRVSKVEVHHPVISSEVDETSLDGYGALLAPSLCHPHVHLDKAFLLSHPKYDHLQIRRGNFAEAMDITGQAKGLFQEWDILERGQRLIDESVEAGVTHMRAFVEVDPIVDKLCLNAGIKLKTSAEDAGQCIVQLCAFAQLPLFTPSGDDLEGIKIRTMMHSAAQKRGVDVLGSTPYVEESREKMKANVEWMVDLAIQYGRHLDFHLDYNTDLNTEPLIWHVIRTLKARNWNERQPGRTIVLGHCTRLCLLSAQEWGWVRDEIGDLPISFVGLPSSDLFMMRPAGRTRGTLDLPALIKEHKLNACMGINNIGNAFTPYGTCDPLMLACMGVGIYQAGTDDDATLLYECVSTRARRAIGMDVLRNWEGSRKLGDTSLGTKPGDKANRLLFVGDKGGWKTRKTVTEAVYLYDNCRGRRAVLGGLLTAEDTAFPWQNGRYKYFDSVFEGEDDSDGISTTRLPGGHDA